MTSETDFDNEFNIETITSEIVNKIKTDVKSKYGNKKRHKQ
jgi:hypothetical protein